MLPCEISQATIVFPLNKVKIQANCTILKFFLPALLLLTTALSYGQNKTNLVEGILKNPEYKSRWSAIEQMRHDGLNDNIIWDLLNPPLSNNTAKISSENPNTITNETAAKIIPPPPSINASCSGLSVESGWGAWTARTGTRSNGTIIWDQAVGGGVTPFYPRFNIKSGLGMDGCTPGPNSGDPTIPYVSPGFGNYSLQIGQPNTNGFKVEELTYPLTVTANDTNFIYSYAIVIEDPGHPVSDQPFVSLGIYDQSGNAIPCGYFMYIAGSGLPGFYTANCAYNSITYYKPWTLVGVNLKPYIGQTLKLVITNADCGQGQHYAHSYFDFNCGTLNVNSTQIACGSSVAMCGPDDPLISYTYDWYLNGTSTGLTSQCILASVHTGDVFTVEVSQPSGCGFNIVYQPQVNAGPSATSSGTNPTCMTAGSATVSATGGVTPYTYSWSNGKTTSTITGLSSGTYVATVTDHNGCSTTQSVTITQSSGPSATASGTNPTCVTAGSATVSTTGGTVPYAYSWTNGKTTSVVTGLFSGTYTVTVTDHNGCTTTQTVTLTQAAGPSATSSGTNPTCVALGSVTVSPTGGTTPYTYSWSNGKTTSSVTGLSSGTYIATVTDHNGCSTTQSVTITQAAGPSATSLGTNPTCVALGSVTVSPTGGTTPYTYSWSNGKTTSSITGLSSGTYVATVTDHNGCSTTQSVTITQAPSPNATSSGTNPTCVTAGSVTVSATGGTTPYTYSWSNGKTTSSVTGLSSGTYVATVTDHNGCSTTQSVTITQSGGPSSTTSGMNPTCATAGSVTVTATGGNTPYTYSWSNGKTTSSITGLSSGTYVATVTDHNGCSTTQSVTITQAPSPNATSSGTNPTCVTAGSVTVSATGGTTPYTYSWSNGKTTSSVTGLSSGTYVATVTDQNGCSTTQSVTITQAPGPNATSSGTNPTCVALGSVTVSPTGGTTPYTYSWSNGKTTSSVTGLSSGTYVATVTDHDGCSTTQSVTITQAAGPSATSSGTNPTCVTAGSVTVTATGGTGTYTYSWSPGGKTTSAVTGLSSGIYVATVTDHNGCSTTQSVTITQLGGPNATTVGINANCGIANGSANVNASGGTSPYTYSWSNGKTTSSITGLSSGTYVATVTDHNGCSTTQSVTITQTGGPSAVVSGINPTCIALGSVTVSATAGTTPYTYSWSNGKTTSGVTGLSSGTYTATVTDHNGCSTTQSVTITQAAGPTATSSGTNPTCVALGSVTVSPTGGTTPYIYSWSNGKTTSTITGLSSGTYVATVTDHNGCSTTQSVTITQAAGPSATSSGTNPTCATAGSVTVSATAGTTPYTYSWSNGKTTSAVTGLSSGTYVATVTDHNGCSTTQSVTITQSDGPNATTAGINATCGTTNGSATVNVSGGVNPYFYLWSSGETTTSITGISAGTYSVVVTDANGCSDSQSFTIAQEGSPLASSSGTNPTCVAPGSVSISVTGGTAPYSYLWTNGITTSTVTGLSSGTYIATITDANGCSATQSVTITQAGGPSASSSGIDPTCLTAGSATVAATGGTAPYSYVWANGVTTSTVTGLSSGTYSATVTDANGCSITQTVTITQAAGPNSTAAGTNPTCITAGSVTVSATAGIGAYTYLWNNGQTTSAVTGLSSGTYIATVIDGNGCSTTQSVTITQTGGPNATITGINATCGMTNGSASVIASGGISPYSYWWNSGETTSSITNISAGTYSVVVTDANGCSDNQSLIIAQAGSPTVTSSGTNPTCIALGSVSASATGGTAPYSYLWANGITTSTVTGLASGIYIATVTDANGCSTTQSVTITQSGGPNATAAATNPTCVTAGSVTVTVAGGTSPYTYAWSNGQSSSTLSGLSSGSYEATITDANGCSTTQSVTITQSGGPSANSSEIDPTCITAGSATIVATGGTAPYSYLWTNGVTTSTITGLSSGTYTATVTDADGCSTIQSVTLAQSAGPHATTLTMNATCGAANGSANVTVNGGTGPYSYWWSSGTTTTSITGVPAGTYSVIVTDANGCSDTQITNIINGNSPVAAFSNGPVCLGNTSVFTDNSSPAPGDSITSWSWNFGDGSNSISQNPSHTYTASGTYSVTHIVSNGFGCKDSVQHTILVNPLPVANFSLNPICQGAQSCFGDLSTISFGTISSWSWNFGDSASNADTSNQQNPCYVYSSAGIFSVTLTVTSNNNCQNTITQSETVHPSPAASFTSTTACLGARMTLNDNSIPVPGDPIILWNWIIPSGNPATASSQDVSVYYITAGTHSVTLIVTSQEGCTDSIIQLVQVHDLPIASFGEPKSGCVPVCNSYMDLSNATDGTINSWQWNFPGGNPSSSSSQNPNNISYNAIGSYGASLIITTDYGCRDTIKIDSLVNVSGWPKAGFCVSPDQASINDPVFNFCDLWTPNPGVTNWLWDFGDGSPPDSISTDPMHSYSETITNNDYYSYTVTLLVKNQYGCWDTTSKEIKLLPEFSFYIPNTFTPNGDNNNEFFFGKSRGVKEYNIWIFDRWGNTIWDCHYVGTNTEWDGFQQDGMSSACKWDGVVEKGGMDMNGNSKNLAQEDVYVWKVALTDIFNKQHTYTGQVNIVR